MVSATATPKRFEFEEINKTLLNGRNRQMRLVMVTPELASDLLNRNKRNRPLNALTVARYARDLVAGLFRSTAQPIVIDWNGDLLDGQHRLWAVVDSGVAIEMYIATGEDPDTFAAYDRGRKRSPGDVLTLLDYSDGNTLGAAANRLHRHLRGVTWSTTASDREVNLEEMIKIVEEFPGLASSVKAARRLIAKEAGNAPLAPPSLAAFLHYLFAEKDADHAEWFFNVIASGAGLEETDAALHLRRRLIQNKVDTKAKLPDKELAALFVKAWNAHREGRPVRVLRWRTTGSAPEPFPEIR
jgi:hypothetical protein